MNKRGISTIEMLAWMAAASSGTVVWAYSTFITEKTVFALRDARDKRLDGVDRRLERIEDGQKEILRELRK